MYIGRARAYRQYTEWESLRVWNSIWFLLSLDPRRRNRRWVGREGPGGVAVVRHPRKGGAPRGARLTRHPAGSSHSYCQLPTLRPSRSSLALDFGWFQPLPGCSSYIGTGVRSHSRHSRKRPLARRTPSKRNLWRILKDLYFLLPPLYWVHFACDHFKNRAGELMVIDCLSHLT